MKLLCFLNFAALMFLLAVSARAADLTGTWNFSVDLENGQHGDPVFVLKQSDGKLTGTYRGPFGDQAVAGKLSGEALVLEVGASQGDATVNLTYKASSRDRDKMSGTMTRSIAGKITRGTWTATRKQ